MGGALVACGAGRGAEPLDPRRVRGRARDDAARPSARPNARRRVAPRMEPPCVSPASSRFRAAPRAGDRYLRESSELLILPWVLWSPATFVDGVFLWFNDIDKFPRAKWLENRAWLVHPGLAGLFWTMHAERLLKPLQAIFVAGLAVLYARRTAAAGPRAPRWRPS